MNLRATSQIGCKSGGPEEQNRLQNIFFFLYHLTFNGFLISILDTVSEVLINSQVFGAVISVNYYIITPTFLRRKLPPSSCSINIRTVNTYVLLAKVRFQYKEFTTY